MEDSQVSLSRRRDLDHAGNIPFDLIIEILSRLPAKPLIRFQSVSKLWFSTIRSKNFVDSFMPRSQTRPRLLLPYKHVESRKGFILSAPEHNNKEDIADKSSSSTVIPRHDMTFSDSVIVSRPVNGLICCIGGSWISVCNPATRQIVKLPDVTPNGRYMHASLGYDPVQDQYKVVCLFVPDQQYIQPEHLVCTVTTSHKQEWRKIDNTNIGHFRAVRGGICIDGAIYYTVGRSMIVRFDVKTENIELIKASEEFSTRSSSSPINYKGKLGVVDYADNGDMILWILEDAKKHEWSSMTCVLPSEFEDLPWTYEMFKEDIHKGDLMVFHPWIWSLQSFSVLYYDFKKESIIRKVEVMVDADFKRMHGIGERTGEMLCYPGYFENIRFL